MLVKDYMSTEVITTSPETPVFQAMDLMKQKNIHRLPVVKDDQLVGLVTEGTIQEAMPSKATSLSVYEVNYLLNKMTVADVMIKDVHTIKADEFIEEAIKIMREYNIGVLPVVDVNRTIQGIITSTDAFGAFLAITGYGENGTRVAISIKDDHPGVLADLTKVLAQDKFNIVQIIVYRQTKNVIIVIQVVEKNATKLEKSLIDNQYDVIMCLETERS
ncbi:MULTISPECIES: CBS and ACT domain-containing protein [unclassified Vagococcus]|uniref:CBS and ACT domain-containing protein n=1 Tax=unclassified Vagococcus TaxID=2648499 RepID=UPI001F50620C|nr:MULTISPECIES: CBS and ACT domain-containing protein [unclassified Vagococcus]MCI0129581.1 CBS and ACT domain-containing protein [Vagococcus sp. CY53-2]UNM90227.1 CBS and ACT domain-containing protein [Vagococcus sp. CY52-2]